MTNINVNTNYNAVNLPNIKNLPVIEMKPGQVFQGTILRVHPNNIAIVQLGEAIFPAKLSAQLPIGQKIIMEVIEATNPITLKAISEHMPSFQQKTDLPKGEFKQIEHIDIKSLLQNMGVKPTKENILFAEQLTKYNLPINKENLSLIQRLNTTNSTNIKEIVESMKIAENKSLPLTENTVKSIQNFLFGKGIDNLVKDVHSNIHLLLSSKKEFPISVKPILENLTKALTDLIKMDNPKVEQNNNNSFQKNTVVNKESSHLSQYRDNLISSVKDVSRNNLNNPINQNSNKVGTTSVQQKPVIDVDITIKESNALRSNNSEVLPKEVALKDTVAILNKNSLEIQSSDEVQGAVKTSVVEEGLKGNSMPSTIMETLNLLKKLGVLNEKDIFQHLHKHSNLSEHQSNNIKNLLMQVIHTHTNEQPLPSNLVKSAESLLNHITGQQLFISTNDNNVLQNLTFQVPVQLLNETSSVLVQLEQRKDKSKKWDSDNCSLFFYLSMEKMGDTMISLQINNKVMSMSLYNDKPWIEQLINKFKPSLESKLKDKGYLLSSFKVLSKDNIPHQAEETTPIFEHLGKKYKGVDIKI